MAIKKKNEFRINNSKDGRGHPAYIHGEKGKYYVYVGITHSDVTDNQLNIPLNKNPNPNDHSPSYMRNKSEEKNKASFGKKLKGWKLSDEDKNKVPKLKIKMKNSDPDSRT